MSIAEAFKAETTRLAKKVARQQTEPLRAAIAAQRKAIAELREQVAAVQKQLKTASRAAPKALAASTVEPSGRRPRFSAELCKSRRLKLGLSQEAYGKLLGVSGLTVYNYEKDRSVPQGERLTAFGELATIGKREAHSRLAAIDGA